MTRFWLILGVLVALTAPALAHARHHHAHYRHHYAPAAVHVAGGTSAFNWPWGFDAAAQPAYGRAPVGRERASRHIAYDDGRIVSHPAGCPWVASCGCIASVKVFGHPVRDLYLAANWGRFPSAVPAPGMAAYRAHHVFIIDRVLGGDRVIAYDGNSGGHLTRIHEVSLAGYRVVNPRGGRYSAL